MNNTGWHLGLVHAIAPAEELISFIYKIDSELGVGDSVPNLGNYPFGNDAMTIIDIGDPEFGTPQLNAHVGGLSFSWGTGTEFTWIVRMGDVATPAAEAASGGVGSSMQGGTSSYYFGYVPQAGVSGVTYNTSFVISPHIQWDNEPVLSDSVVMATWNIATGTTRMVQVVGGSLVDVGTSSLFTGGLYPSGEFVLYRSYGFVSGAAAHWTWEQSANGIGMWFTYAATDADFLALYNEFLTA